VLLVQAGNEPELFISQFQNWDFEYAAISATAGSDGSFVDMYQLQQNAIRESNSVNTRGEAEAAVEAIPAVEEAPAAERTPVKESASTESTPSRTTPSRRPVSTRVAPRPQAASYLNMRSSDMSNSVKAANPNAFAFVSGGAGSGAPIAKSSVSSANYLNMRSTDMSNTAAKAANSNAFAFVSGGSGSASTPAAVPAPANAPLVLTEDELVAYDDLVYEPPAHVDGGRKEEYLHDEDFQEIFLMSKEEFRALPKWKRDNKKKELQLF